MKVLLATNHKEIDAIFDKLETARGIAELAEKLQRNDLKKWAAPITVVDQALYRERVLQKALAAKPDVIVLYDKLPGTVDLGVLLEEIRLEVKNSDGIDCRVILLTSLSQGDPLLRQAVEIGVWDIISGQEICPFDIIQKLYFPANYSTVAHYKLASDEMSRIKLVPKYIEVEKTIKEKEYVRVGASTGVKESILFWSPYASGKTFLSVNLASAMAKRGLTTALVDLNRHNPSLDGYFSLTSEESFVFLNSLAKRFQGPQKCHIHCKNLKVLALPTGKIELPEFGAEDFISFYDALRQDNDIIIMDGDSDLSASLMKNALRLATRIFLVVTLDPRHAKYTRITIQEMGLGKSVLQKFSGILNMYVKTNLPQKKDIGEILGIKLIPVEVPAVLEAAYKSMMTVIPAYEDNSPADFIQAMDRLVSLLCGESKPARKRLWRLWD